MFTSSLDADADGREGSTYVWTPAQLTEVLGDNDGHWAASVFGVTAAGTFEDGASVLQRPGDPDDPDRLERVRAALLAARLTRPQPARDDKVVTGWNGLAITALAEAGVALAAPELVVPQPIARQSCSPASGRRPAAAGQPGRPGRRQRGILEDHAMLATGLLALYQLTTEAAWLTAATALLDLALAHFADRDNPGRWFDSADDGEQLLLRPADPYDGATPSGASAIAEALLTAAHLTGGGRALPAGGRRYAAGTFAAAGPRAAFGRPLAGRRRSRRSRPVADRGGLRRPGFARCWPTPADRARRRDRGRRRGGLLGAAGRSRPGRRRRRRLRVPRPGLRPAGHQRRGIGGGARPVTCGP